VDLSIIIVNYNVRHFLEQCLGSLKKASGRIKCEIIVVDNNSADGSCSMVSSRFPEAFLIRNSSNLGFAAGCNQGIKISKGKYILLLNPDTVVEEDTFDKCINFMEMHPEAGATGVKMINGSGRLLPESKRAFPTPLTAFFKMSGLSAIFPGSRFFNRYYLGHLDSSKTSEADILSGAFMLIRREAIEKTGPLDESYFMYGEDIDLSYRLTRTGYKNYYFPETRIIHYKGESTRRSDLNYLIYFYRAMLIFIRKHFTGNGYLVLRILLNIAVYFHGILAVIKNFGKRYFLPMLDAAIIIAVFLLLIPAWEKIKFGGSYHYPGNFTAILLPSYTSAILISVWLSGGYKIPSRFKNVIRGLAIGTGSALAIYSLLPQDLRFSRAVVLFGGLISAALIPAARLLIAVTGTSIVRNPFPLTRRIAVAINENGYSDICNLLKSRDKRVEITGRISLSDNDLGNEVLGNIDQLKEIIRINRITEVIFSTRDITAAQIISSMQVLSDINIAFRMASPGEKVIIGSRSLHLHEDFK
jgi:GT2 family glycosyltransferase